MAKPAYDIESGPEGSATVRIDGRVARHFQSGGGAEAWVATKPRPFPVLLTGQPWYRKPTGHLDVSMITRGK